MHSFKLDNMTGQEIKEMINEKAIVLEDLDYSSLLKVLDHEIDMLVFGSGDMVFINKCSDLIEAKETDPIISDERFDEIIENTLAEHTVTVSDGEKETRGNKPDRTTRRIVLRRFAIVAAAIITIFATTTLVAAAFGVNIFEYIKEAARKPQSEAIVADGLTFYRNKETTKYSSIEQMIDEEELDIMYPTVLPDGITIENIRYIVEADGKETVRFFTNDTNTNVKIVLSSEPTIGERTEVLETDGKTYFIQRGDQILVAFVRDNNTYYIAAKTVDDAFLIIENMKE